MFKRKAPILIAVFLFIALVAAITLIGAEPRDSDLLAPAARYLKDRYNIAPESMKLSILSRTDREGYVLGEGHYLHLTCEDDWKVANDLLDVFEKYLKEQKVVEDLPRRIVDRLGGGPIDPSEKLYFSKLVNWRNGPIGLLRASFEREGSQYGYEEAYVLKDGQWTQDGQGQLQHFTQPIHR